METNETALAAPRLAEAAVRLAEIDTLYGDLYVERGRELLSSVLTRADYEVARHLESEALQLPDQIDDAISVGSWERVGKLSERLAKLERTISEQKHLLALGTRLYGPAELRVSPFSRGVQRLSAFPGAPEEARERGIALLERLHAEDPDARAFYASRLEALRVGRPAPGAEVTTEDQLRRDAQRAFADGRFDELARISRELESRSRDGPRPEDSPARRMAGDLTFSFPPDVVARAARLGLVPERATRREELAPVRRAIGQRSFGETGYPTGEPVRLPLPVPADAPQARRDRVELLASRAFVNSAGLRMLSPLEDEDVLVEPFDDPPPDTEPPRTALLDELRLPSRRGLSRRRIEGALLEHGQRVVRGLGLDPCVFRLLCLPPDLQWRLGERRGWGRQETWTHLDGYMLMPGGAFLALAGGDVRFGGVFDLVALSRDNDSDHLFARFCVVQRHRMAAG